MNSVLLNSPKMHCEGCRKTIIKTLKHLKGVKKVEVDLENKNVGVDYDSSKIDVKDMLVALATINYPSTVVNN